MLDSIPLLVDTDIGTDVDDAVCLAYVLAEPRCELLGVSTVSGQARERAMLADAICRAAGRPDVPIWSGTDDPLLVGQRQECAQQAEVLSRWPHREDFVPGEAVSRMQEIIRGRPGEVTLLTIGPLTNVALLFALNPEVPRMLKRLVMMAGRFFNGDGPEWNASCDPHATAIVFGADVPEVWVHGLDVTLQCRMSADECRQRFRGGPLDMVAEMAEVWFRRTEHITFHDPLAGACIFEPETCTYCCGTITVEVCGPGMLGRTMLEENPDGAHRVADGVNAERFFEHYFSTVQRAEWAADSPRRDARSPLPEP